MSNYTAPHWKSAALIVIDVQHDSLDGGAAPVAGTSDIVSKLVDLTQAFRVAGRPICHVVRLYVPGGSDVDLPRRAQVENGARIVAPGSDGSGTPLVADALDGELLLRGEFQHVGPNEVVMFKPRWSAFHRTPLQEWLDANDCDTVVVAGCNLPNCPRATLFDASERDFRTVLAKDAVSQATPERLDDLARIGVNLMAAKDIAAEV